MNKWRLPTSLVVGEVAFEIRTDYRVILGIYHYLNDPEYTDEERWAIALRGFYKNIEAMSPDLYVEAAEKMLDFLRCGATPSEEDKDKPQMMDWDQDADIIIPSVNKVAGEDVRGLKYLHWWTFFSYYLEITEGTFATVIGIRDKMAHGKKLEDYEKDFCREHPSLVFLKKHKTEEELRKEAEDREALAKLLGER